MISERLGKGVNASTKATLTSHALTWEAKPLRRRGERKKFSSDKVSARTKEVDAGTRRRPGNALGIREDKRGGGNAAAAFGKCKKREGRPQSF